MAARDIFYKTCGLPAAEGVSLKGNCLWPAAGKMLGSFLFLDSRHNFILRCGCGLEEKVIQESFLIFCTFIHRH